MYPPIKTYLTREPYDIPVSVEVIGRIMAGPDENVWTLELGECAATETVYANDGRLTARACVCHAGDAIELTDAEREMIEALGTQRHEAEQRERIEPDHAPDDFSQAMPNYDLADAA